MAIEFTKEEIESERLERLADIGEDLTDEQFCKKYGAGSYGCHEALHASSMIMHMVDSHLLDHGAIALDKDLFRYASEAHTALFNLYQAIGAKHFNDEQIESESE